MTLEEVGKVDIEAVPLCHQLRLPVCRQAEVGEVKDGALELLGVDLVAPGLGVGRHLIVDVLDLELLVGRRENKRAARKALLELLQLERIGAARERRAGELIKLPCRDEGHRGVDRAALWQRGTPRGLRRKEALGERGARPPGRVRHAEAVRESDLAAGHAAADVVVVAVAATVRHALDLKNAVLLNDGHAVGLRIQDPLELRALGAWRIKQRLLGLRKLQLDVKLVEFLLEDGKEVALLLLVRLEHVLRVGDLGLLGGDLHHDRVAGHFWGGCKKRDAQPVQFFSSHIG